MADQTIGYMQNLAAAMLQDQRFLVSPENDVNEREQITDCLTLADAGRCSAC